MNPQLPPTKQQIQMPYPRGRSGTKINTLTLYDASLVETLKQKYGNYRSHCGGAKHETGRRTDGIQPYFPPGIFSERPKLPTKAVRGFSVQPVSVSGGSEGLARCIIVTGKAISKKQHGDPFPGNWDA